MTECTDRSEPKRWRRSRSAPKFRRQEPIAMRFRPSAFCFAATLHALAGGARAEETLFRLDSLKRLNSTLAGSQLDSRIACTATQSPRVTWQSPQDGNQVGVVARRLQPTGTPVGDEIPVNTFTTAFQDYGVVA